MVTSQKYGTALLLDISTIMKNFNLLLLLLTFTLSCTSKKTQAPSGIEDTKIKESVAPKIYGIQGDGIEIYTGPGKTFSKLVNEKATEVLKKTQYATVDHSVKVTQDSIIGDWSKISVVDPEWLSNSHHGWILTKNIITDETESKKEVNKIVKIEKFQNPENLSAILSENGIGQLNQWKKDYMGWISLSFYFPIGEQSSVNGMENNLAYYLESKNEEYVEELKLVLNINNSEENAKALSTFADITRKTFHSIDQKVPAGLIEAIKKQKEFKAETINFKASLELEKSKINTWKVKIITK